MRLVHGVVRSVEGANPGPASGITYTVSMNLPDIKSPVLFPGVVPHNTRYPDALDTRAAEPGTVVSGVLIGEELQLTIIELPDFAECP